MSLITYLACPYTHDDETVRFNRCCWADKTMAYLVWQGRTVFSPISMSHEANNILEGCGIIKGSDFWVDFDESFMAHCHDCVVLTIDGWDRSYGVKREIQFFQMLGRDVTYLDPQEVTKWM